MSLNLPFGIQPVNPMSNNDERYGPHNSIGDALTATAGTRKEGLTVGVIEGGNVVEYWFESGIGDGDLVLKTAEGGAQAFTGLTDTPNNYIDTNYIRSTTSALEYRTPAQVLSDIQGICRIGDSIIGNLEILNAGLTISTDGTGGYKGIEFKGFNNNVGAVINSTSDIGTGNLTNLFVSNDNTIGNALQIFDFENRTIGIDKTPLYKLDVDGDINITGDYRVNGSILSIPNVGNLNTTSTTALATNSSESFTGNISLHRVSKTGCYAHLIGLPTIPTVNNSTVNINTTSPIGGGGSFTLNQSGTASLTITHDTSGWTSKSNLTNAAVISNLTVDSRGHISNWTTRNLTAANIGAESAFAKGNLVAGTNISLTGTLTNRLVGSGNVTINLSGTFDNYQNWCLCGVGVTGTQTISSGNVACFAGGTDLTVTRSSGLITFNHAAYTARNVSATGSNVISCVVSNARGHVTNVLCRSLTPANIGAEPAFAKGNLVAGTNVSLTGTLTNRLVGSGNVTINATASGMNSFTVGDDELVGSGIISDGCQLLFGGGSGLNTPIIDIPGAGYLRVCYELDSSVLRTSGNQSASGLKCFTDGILLGSTITTTNGIIRWTGSDFQGRRGGSWVSLTDTGGNVCGSGTAGRAARFTSSNTIANSAIRDDGANCIALGANVVTGHRIYALQGTGCATIFGCNNFVNAAGLAGVAGFGGAGVGGGYLGVNIDGSLRAGVYGQKGTCADAYAGYFDDRVGVEGELIVGGGNNAMICLGTSSSSRWEILRNTTIYLCMMYNNSSVFRWRSNGSISLGGTNPSASACIGTGVDWVATSDCRIKRNINPISNALSTVNSLCGVCYSLCDDESNETHLGLLAQDVLKVAPELISKSEPSEEDIEKYGITDVKYGLKYDKITALLIEGIKEQQKQINELKNEINILKNK